MTVELDSNGFVAGATGRITTWTGATIDPLNPDPSDIHVEDIAHALSRLCRYNGHVAHFLSVARHSLWVSERVYTQTNSNPELALAGLLHDGAEAYLSDVPRPVKQQLDAFQEYDRAMDLAVMDAFGLPYPLDPIIHATDEYVLLEVEMPAPAGARYTWASTPQEDEHDWLARYYWLTAQIERLAVRMPEQRPRLIGLMGYAQAGKDTVGTKLGGYGYRRLAFADTLRAMAYALNPLVPVPGARYEEASERLADLVDEHGWDKAKVEFPEIRQLLQRLGTEAGRNVLGDSIWVDTTMSQMNAASRYVITDVRFPNEYDAVKAAGGELWRIIRKDHGAANAHASEHSLDGHEADRTIFNDGSKQDLEFQVGRTLEAL